MIAQRHTKTMSTDELSTYLCEAGLNGDLSKADYEEIMAELSARELNAETLAVLSTFGRPEWRAGQVQFK
jgi:hypothetical protein